MRRSVRDLGILVVLVLVVGPGCMSPRIRERLIRPRAAVETAAWSLGTIEQGTGSKNEADFARLKAQAEGPGGGNPELLLDLADRADEIGCRQFQRDAAAALPWFRDSAVYAMFALASPAGADPVLEARAVVRHNEAVERLLRCAGADPRQEKSPWRERLAVAGIEVVQTAPERASLPADQVWIARDFRVRNLESVAWNGLGVPLVAVSYITNRQVAPDRFLPPKLKIPATALLRTEGPLQGGAWQTRPVRLELHDPARGQSVPLGAPTRGVPLAADLTTPLAHQLISSALTQLAWGGLLRPESYRSMPGVFMKVPYQRGKIPVLFVHGLWSSPDAWLKMTNELQGDPAIRNGYQFWYAYYPTGAPMMSSAVRLRRSLHDLRQSIDPTGSDPALNQMVVVGHSLGGVLSKQLLQSSGQRIEQGLFTRPFAEVAMTPETRDKLSRFLYFEPEPFVRRVVFIAAPHRGSNTANQFIGRLGSALVREPGEIAQLHAEIIALNGADVAQPAYRRRPPNSIDNLSWDSPILKALSELPITPGVPYHSIVANLFPDASPRFWTDGVVSYESAHLDGAESEIMIRHNHFANDTHEASVEVLRILRLHLEQHGRGVLPTQARAVGSGVVVPR